MTVVIHICLIRLFWSDKDGSFTSPSPDDAHDLVEALEPPENCFCCHLIQDEEPSVAQQGEAASLHYNGFISHRKDFILYATPTGSVEVAYIIDILSEDEVRVQILERVLNLQDYNNIVDIHSVRAFI